MKTLPPMQRDGESRALPIAVVGHRGRVRSDVVGGFLPCRPEQGHQQLRALSLCCLSAYSCSEGES